MLCSAAREATVIERRVWFDIASVACWYPAEPRAPFRMLPGRDALAVR